MGGKLGFFRVREMRMYKKWRGRDGSHDTHLVCYLALTKEAPPLPEMLGQGVWTAGVGWNSQIFGQL